MKICKKIHLLFHSFFQRIPINNLNIETNLDKQRKYGLSVLIVTSTSREIVP